MIRMILFTAFLSNHSLMAQNTSPDGSGTDYLRYVNPPKVVEDESSEVLIEKLIGLKLLPNADLFEHGVVTEGIDAKLLKRKLPDKVEKTLKTYIDKPVSLKSLDKMVKESIAAFRDSDQPIVDILLPEQDITAGTIQLILVEKTGGIRVDKTKP